MAALSRPNGLPDGRYPAVTELFARAPDGLQSAEDSELTLRPPDEAVASLSAILLNEAYDAFIMDGRRDIDRLPWVGENRLIPLKGIAWLELTARKEQGAKGDASDVRKHLTDVLALSQLLATS